MRIISSVELNAVAGGEWWNSWDDLKEALGMGGGATCTPSSSTSGQTTTTQLCGTGGTSTLVTTSPGMVVTQLTMPATTVTGGVSVGPVAGSASYSSGTVITTTCINGGCTTRTN